MSLRPAPGPQLARGRVRVDAAKAIAKLREYQLADKTAWVLEAIRAAVASSATRVELRGDANDVWLSWDGPPWPADDLPRLFDELVSPEATAERHHLRLLASGVNSALGTNPAYVDVFAIAATGGAVRTRFLPGMLEDAGPDSASSLRELVAEEVAVPAGVAPGMLVHLRRRASLGLLSFLWEREPPELPLARAACEDLPIPLHVGRDIYARDRPRRDVVRAPFELGDAAGYVALVDGPGQDTEVRVEVAERGVALSRYGLTATALTDTRVPVPLRLFVDAPRMPTNASRSQVRREQHPIAAAEARLPTLLSELADRVTAAMQAKYDERVRGAAVAWLAAAIGGPAWRTTAQSLTGPLRELAKLPLLRTATDGRRSLLDSWGASVHTGRDPFPEELERWLGDVLWIPPGDPAALLVVGTVVDGGAMRRMASWARAQRRADRAFFAHAPRAPVVTSSRRARMRAPLGTRIRESVVPPAWFQGLTGEVCVYGDRAGGELVVLFHGRELDRVTFESPIGFAAVIDAPDLTPTERYRGVVRADATYARVERAMRGGVLCLVEAIALEQLGGAIPDGFVASSDGEHDPRILREGLGLVGELDLWTKYPLADVPLWPTTAGRTVSITDISAHQVIGVVQPGVTFAPPAGRLTLVADARERARITAAFTRVRVIHYDDTRSRRANALDLARALAGTSSCALVIAEGGLAGAIALSPVRSLRLHHMGALLADRPYTGSVVSCTISVDSEDIVPSADWQALTDDAGLGHRDYSAWETALLRAGARALIGERVPELVGGEVVSVESELGAAVILALSTARPAELLGDDLLERLRAAPLARLLGVDRPCSIDEVAHILAGPELPFVDRDAEPLSGFHALASTRTFATAVARILHRSTARYVGDELVLRRRAAARDIRHAQHRERATREVALEGRSVPLELAGALTGTGFVALGTAGLEIDVLVEQRPFTRLTRRSGAALRAIVDVDPRHVDHDFLKLGPGVLDKLILAVEKAALRVVAAHVGDDPSTLADSGPVRELATIATTDVAQSDIPPELRKAEAFIAIHGPRVSIERALRGRSRIAVASWHGDYLHAAPGTAAHGLDGCVIYFPDGGGLRQLLEQLSGGALDDVTTDIQRLQARRSMERGLVPMPTVPIAPYLKCALHELGSDGEQLGPGEIGLCDDERSQLLVHVKGTVMRTVTLSVTPPVKLALDEEQLQPSDPFDFVAAQLRALTLVGPEPRTLEARVQLLAIQLVRRVAERPDDVPWPIRRRLKNALLEGVLLPSDVSGLPVFETLDGGWVKWGTLEEQAARYGSAWAVPRVTPETPRPVDPDRIVVVLDVVERGHLRDRRITVIDATKELELDALAERNRLRPLATSLDFGSREGVLAEARLDEVDGRRGTVALLAPSSAGRRGLWAHRAMLPFDVAADPCRWPTVAYVDDPKLTPDRTWSYASNDEVWQQLVVAVRNASGHLVGKLVEAPAGKLATYAIEPHTFARLVPNTPETAVVVGKLWLAGEPYGKHEVRVVGSYGVTVHAPAYGAAIEGALFAYTPDGWQADAVEKLCAAAHGELVRYMLRSNSAVDNDLVAAHAMHALALKRVLSVELRYVRPACIVPRDAMAFFTAAALHDVRVYPAGSTSGLAEPAIIDDGSVVARTLITALADRVRRDAPAAPPPAPARTVAKIPDPPPRRPPHPLEPLAASLEDRLRELRVLAAVRIAGRDEPILRYTAGCLELAGDNARLAAVANACSAGSPWAAACVDALAAHALTVLDVALTQMTEAAQLHAIGALLLES